MLLPLFTTKRSSRWDFLTDKNRVKKWCFLGLCISLQINYLCNIYSVTKNAVFLHVDGVFLVVDGVSLRVVAITLKVEGVRKGVS